MRKAIMVGGIVLMSIGLAACSNRDIGTVTGGAVGGLVGSQFGSGSGQVAAASVGTLIGAMIGNRIGGYMDKVDRMEMTRALENTPTGRTSTWTNPDTGYQYAVQPTNTYTQGNQPCRNFTTTAMINGQQEQVSGTACRMADGNWKIVN